MNETKRPWSLVLTDTDGYANEIFTFKTKAEARAQREELGEGSIIHGTQMWNEPVGQVEEDD